MKKRIKNWCRYWHYNILGVLQDNEGHRNYLNIVNTLEDFHNIECYNEDELDLKESWKNVLKAINMCNKEQLETLNRLCTSRKY